MQFSSGFVRPCDITHCGDDRLFVVEQRGMIWILDQNGNKLPNPFLNIDPSVGSSGNEQGLLGLAFHPNYAQNGHFYVNYTDNNGDTKVSRFTVSANNPNLADAASEVVLLTADQPYSNHNGGCLKFGPDGYLYIGLGDGGSGGDPQANGQKRTTFLGKMLRIDVVGGTPYAVPADNPFVNDATTLDEIWALGLRNPWRFSFDRQTGDLWIGDVGQDSWEEIDFQPASSIGGENYGWRCYEGTHTFNTSNCPNVSELTMPVAEYANSGSLGCSVTGGFVYRGFKYPQLFGKYLYTDYCTGRLWTVVPDGMGGWTNSQIADLINNQLVSFGENKNGELFMLGNGNGLVYRIHDATEDWSYQVNVVNEPICAGSTEGIIQLVFPSNLPIPNIVWSDGGTGSLRTDLPAGTYTATITGSNGAVATETIVLNSSVYLSTTVSGVTCAGAVDGAIGIVVIGSQGTPTAVWSDGVTGLERIELPEGSYSVTVTTTEGCVFEETYEITSLTAISLSGTVTNVSCPGGADGSIDLTINATTAPPSSVNWSNGSSSLDLNGLSGGEYSVTVTSAEGCVMTATYLVEEPFWSQPPFASLVMDSMLFIEDLYDSYQWLLNGEPIPGANSPNYTAQESGIYSVQITSLGCTYLSNNVQVVLSATSKIEEITSVTVTPNPFQQSIRLEVTVSKPVFLELSINDLQGKTILTDRLAVTSTSTRNYDLGKIPSGTYLLVLKNGNGEWVEKLVRI